MAKGKSKSSGKTSKGGRQKANLAHEAKRQAKFAAKREAGTAYEYKANPYPKGSDAWYNEHNVRAEKNKSSRTDLARWTSVLAKLRNEVNKREAEFKAAAAKKKGTK